MLAPAAELVERAWRAGWRPDPEIDVDEWADANRILTSKSAHVIGPWVTGRFPFSREWMKNVSPSSPVEETIVMAARQLAKTDGLVLNLLGYWMDCRSGPVQVVQPTVDNAKTWVKQRMRPMIEACGSLNKKLGRRRSRDASNTLLGIEYPGGTVRIGGANSSSSLRIQGARVVIGDELGEWTEDADGHGDPLAIVKEGASNFPDRKFAFTGNPGIRGSCRTEREFLRGDQRRYFIPCPHCRHMDIITFQGRDWFGASEGAHHWIEWQKPVPEGEMPVAWMVCGKCAQRVDENQYKTWMLEHGEWRPTAPGNGITRSYQISGLYSPLGFRSWSRVVHTFLGAKDKPNELRSFVTNVLGETWEERSDKVQVAELLRKERLEDYGAEVPHGVGVLVSATDTQDDRLIHSVWGYGAGEECWLIEVRELEGDPRKGDVWIVHDLELERRFLHRSGQLLQIRRAVVDSGGHATDAVYKYCASRRDLGGGRACFAIFGATTQQQPLVGVPKSRRSNRYGAAVFPLCVDTGRADILSRLRIPMPAGGPARGPGFIHLPKGLEEEWIRQLASTRSIWKRSGGQLVREWTRAFHPRDHLFDLATYGLGALRMLGPAFIQRLAVMAGALSEKVEEGPEAPPEPAPEAEPAPEPAIPPQFQPRGSAWVRSALPPGRRR